MIRIPIFALLILLIGCKQNTGETPTENLSDAQPKTEERPNMMEMSSDTLIYPEEKHFKSIKQVTFGGNNAEAYWSFDDKQMIFQSDYGKWGVECDQMFLLNVG